MRWLELYALKGARTVLRGLAGSNARLATRFLRTIQLIRSYATTLAFPLAQVLLRLDGLSGDAAPLIDGVGAGLGVIARSRDDSLLALEVVKQALSHAPNQVSIPEDKRDETCALRLPSRPAFRRADPLCAW